MNTSRLQHLFPASAILLLALVVAWLSFTREPAAAFLFPRLIAVAMLLLAGWNFARAALGLARIGSGLSPSLIRNIAPGIIAMMIYVFFLAKWLGFYAASMLIFVVIYSLYDPAPHSKPGAWAKRITVAFGFMCVMYLLFNLLLKVQTPRGLFF